MVVSGYSMDLYCDCVKCEEYRSNPDVTTTSEGFAEYGGETFKGCLRNAKADGWRFSDNNTQCYAPGHQIKRGEA